jgi:alpha-L-fucosidase
MWFDMGDNNTAFNNELGALVRSLQPKTIMGSRLYEGRVPDSEKKYADFKSLGDRSVATRPVEGYGECPMTTRLNWAYAQHDDHWKSMKLLIEYLVVDSSRGANMLLNFGPKPDGTFTQEDADRLKGIGQWMKVNGESIYGSKARPINFDFPWGVVTQNIEQKRLYLHVLKWNPAGIELAGILGQPSHAYLLADPSHKELVVERKGDVLMIKVPEKGPDENDSVIVLDFPEGIKVDANAKADFHWKATPVMGLSEKSGGTTRADGDMKKAGGSQKNQAEGQ